MEWLRQLFAKRRIGRRRGFRRVILLVFEGLEPALVHEYLEQGLVHYLALLSDIGWRIDWTPARPIVVSELAGALRRHGLRTVVLPAADVSPPGDLRAISAADRGQQERLIAALRRWRPEVVAAWFDMPMQLARLFGPEPDAPSRQVLRDVYARMDEIVGKAFSFVDEQTVLVAAIGSPQTGAAVDHRASPGLLCASCSPSIDVAPGGELESWVLQLLCRRPCNLPGVACT